MKHENEQIKNLLKKANCFSLYHLGINKPVGKLSDSMLMTFIASTLSKLKTDLPIGTIFRVEEEVKLNCSMCTLCIVGSEKMGNVVIFIDKRIFAMETSFQLANPKHIDLIRSFGFSDQMKPKLRGVLGQIYNQYKTMVNTIIEEKDFQELHNLTFLNLVHEYVLTGKIPSYDNLTWNN